MAFLIAELLKQERAGKAKPMPAAAGLVNLLRFWRATINSRNGLAFAIRSEQAIREELIALALAVPLAWLVGATAMRRVELIAVVVLVLVVELLNTAIEKLADRLTTDHDPQIGRVKDMGSAAVGVALADGRRLFWLFAHRRAHRRDLKQQRLRSLRSCEATSAGHDRTRTLHDHAGAAQSDGRRRRRQRRQGARRARARRRPTAPICSCCPELFIAGYPPEDLVLKPAFQAACRAAVEELARETADGGPAMLIGTPWVEDGKLYNACALLDGGRIAAHPLQGQSAELRRVRREAGVRARSGRRAGDDPRRPRRRADLRGHLARRIRGLRERRRMPRRDRRRNPDRAERLALRARQERSAAVGRGGARHRKRAAAGLSQPGRRPGRTGVRRRVVRAQRRPARWRRNCRLSRKASPRCAGARPTPAGAATGRSRRCSTATRATTPPACWACATTSARTAFPACCSAFPAASIRRCARRSRSMRSAPSRLRGVMLPFRFTAQVSLDDAAKLAARARHSLRGAADRARGRTASRRSSSEHLRGPAARHHRRESAGAHPRHAADGDLQQDRRDGGHHRQQVGNVGRLRHALWRHERRLQSDQGHLQDRSVPAVDACATRGSPTARSGRRAR